MMPYMEAVISSLVLDYGDEIIVISWDKRTLTPHRPEFYQDVKFLERSKLGIVEIAKLIQDFNPELIYISGRMDKGYLKALKFSKTKAKVVMGMDTQLIGTFKQLIQILLRSFLYKNYFDFIWIPGQRQYSFARLLGYTSKSILFNLLSGNQTLFSRVDRTNTTEIKTVVFVGRLEKVKGLDLLLEAWKNIDEGLKNDWQLVLIGEGKLGSYARQYDKVYIKGFLPQSEIINLLKGDCIFCLPSRKEPWGVVVHEMAAAGLPMILSSAVGAGDEFLINNYNGYLINKLTVASLQSKLVKMMELTYKERLIMAERSRSMSFRITPSLSAASFRSILSPND